MKKIITVLALTVAAAAAARAGGPGTTGAQFLKIEPSARPLAMGGAYSAVADDSSAVFYNPAGLARINRKEFSGTYLKYFQSINYGSAAGILPYSDFTLGVGINYLGVTGIPRRSADDINDPSGNSSVSTFGAMDTALSVSAALENAVPGILEGVDLGGNLRFAYMTIDDENAFSVMADLGAYYPATEKLAVSIMVKNMGTPVKFISESDPLPLNVTAGAAYRPLEELTVAVDLSEYILDETLYASLGGEYWIRDLVALRAGYKYGYDTETLGSTVGLTGGVGFRYSGMGLDYGFSPFGELGDTHRVTFLINL